MLAVSFLAYKCVLYGPEQNAKGGMELDFEDLEMQK